MILRLCFLLVLALALAPLRAQEDEPVHMRPEFPIAFPLAKNGKDVTVKYPVMINQTTVLKPGMTLRVCYVLSHDSQNPTNLGLAHSSNLEQSYVRDSNGAGDEGPKIPAQLAHEIEGYRRTVWEVPDNFILFLAQYPTDTAHMIYSPTANERDLHDEMFRFFDGLFVGSPNGKVTVIAVEKQSVADKAEMKAGDEILSVGAYPTKDDLLTFSNAFSAAKRDAKENEASSYVMQLRGPDGATRAANLAMPLRIRGGLMDGFSEKP